MRASERTSERGSALIIVLLVVITLVGLGLIVLKQTRTEMSSSGNVRVGRQAVEVAYAGLVRTAGAVLRDPEGFHRRAVQANINNPNLVVGAAGSSTTPAGVFTLPSPFVNAATSAAATFDNDRVQLMQYRATMSNPRLASPPAGFQVGGGQGNRFVFYVYQFDVYGWVNRLATGTGMDVQPGTGGARRLIQADVRIGPISVGTQ